MKVFVATPVYDSKLPIQVVGCLLQEQVAALVSGDEFQFHLLPGCSHPAMGRNQLAQDFLNSGADRLIFLDSDVTFEVGALVKLAHHSVDFVGGSFRYKNDEENYPVGFLKADLWADANGLIEVESLPGGFLSISRNVFEKLMKAHPERSFEHGGRTAHCFFQMPYQDGHLYGEDAYFCKEWRALGGKLFLDPEIKLTHWGFQPTPYVGHIGDWLKSRFAGDRSAGESA